jgi:hypothetical protein
VVRALGRDVFPYVVDLDRQLAVAAVDERDHLHRARAAEVHQRVHRSADGAAGAGDVVHQIHALAVTETGMRVGRGIGRTPRATTSSR